jgi:hypothetical protein
MRTSNPSIRLAATHALDRTFTPPRPKYSYQPALEIPEAIYFPQSKKSSFSQKLKEML